MDAVDPGDLFTFGMMTGCCLTLVICFIVDWIVFRNSNRKD